jgi:hypothetical protein
MSPLPAPDDPAIRHSRHKLLATIGNPPDLVFLRAWGNLGDELIYAGTRQLLAGLDYREESIRDLQNVSGHTALIAGSGGWCRPFHDMPPLLPMVEQRFESVIVLPSSFDISEETVAAALRKTNALVFARELESYRQIQALCKADIAHDCAFLFDYERYRRKGAGILNAFRADAQSQEVRLPEDNIDISLVCSSLEEWLSTLSKYEIVRTNRAHVMIAAAMLGKRVEYKSSGYHKVPGIARYALQGYPVARIPEFIPPAPAASQSEELPVVSRFAHFLAERSGAGRVIFMDDPGALRSCVEYGKDDIVLIRDGLLALERSGELAEPLTRLGQAVQKVILADDLDSFPDTRVAEALLQRRGLPVEFFGYVNGAGKKIGTVALISASKPPLPVGTPEGFRVIALIASFNEEDVIVPVIEQLHQNGIDVYLIDNWSTDGTYQRAQALLGRGLIGSEQFPPSGPSETYSWEGLLKRKEELSLELKADWFIHHDADEIHESPWPGVGLRDAIYWVDQQGYNAIDFTLLVFSPIDDAYPSGAPLAEHFQYCDFGTKEQGALLLIRAWKAAGGKAVLSETGGHGAEFPGRRVYPYKFLLRHYPIRSQSQGENKIYQRKRRWSLLERKRGWHIHYDTCVPGSRFLRNPKALIELNADFYADYLVERLTGIGIAGPEDVIKALQARAAEREQSVRALSARVEMLSARVEMLSAELAAIAGSRTWKAALILRRIRLRLVPPGSRRGRLLRRLKHLVRRQGGRP